MSSLGVSLLFRESQREIRSVYFRQFLSVSFIRTYSKHRYSPLTKDDATRIVLSLNPRERAHLSNALNDTSFEEPLQVIVPQRPSQRQLRSVLLESAFPFVGFGFLDNAIMIVAGEYIDLTIGLALGISTMAAAAFGNLISDLCGLGLADSVEALCRKLGLPNPNLTPSQTKHSSVRWMQRIGRVAGITVGCLLGMAPLYWFNEDTHDNGKQQQPKN